MHARPAGLRGRRELLLWLAGLVIQASCSSPVSSSTPRKKVFQIGYVAAGAPGGPNTLAFEQGLRDLGWVKDENVVIQYRWGTGREGEFPGLIADLLNLNVDVIVATALPATRAAMQATNATPIVMTLIGDPVREGLVERINRPGGNVTGVSTLAPQLSGKRLEVLKEGLPDVSRVAVMYNPSVPDMVTNWLETETAAPPLGVTVVPLHVRSPEDIPAALETARNERADALILLSDDLVFRYRRDIIARATADKLPVIGTQRAYATAGALLAYGPDYAELFRRAAAQVDKILKGTRPADIPIEQPMRFELVVNRDAATALGISLSRTILADATEMVQTELQAR